MNTKDFNPPLDPNSWEKLCDDCYRRRYQKENYQKIPAAYLGDCGIEGYTKTGIVYQCYFPEKEYTDDDLYSHYRDKITNDINKIKNIDNLKKLEGLGLSSIKEWHFVIPEYKDKRILKHLNTKKQELLNEKKQNKNGDYILISDELDLIVKTMDDFIEEIEFILLHKKGDIKIELDLKKIESVDINNCPSEKVKNIIRKIKAIMNVDEENDTFKEVVNAYITYYLEGIEYLNRISKISPALFLEINNLTEVSKKSVESKTRMNTDSKLNKAIFDKILEGFKDELTTISHLKRPAVISLCDSIVAGWLADCNLEFYL